MPRSKHKPRGQLRRQRDSARRAKGRRPNQEGGDGTPKAPQNEPKPSLVPGLLGIPKGRKSTKKGAR